MIQSFLRNLFGRRSKSHLQYSSLEAWADGEGIDTEVAIVQDERLSEQFMELKAHLWEQHYKSLSPEIQKAHAERRHPSQSHLFVESAEPYRKQLEEILAPITYVQKVALGFYHGDQIILQVLLEEPVEWQVWEKDIPRLFEGFQVKVGWHSEDS